MALRHGGGFLQSVKKSLFKKRDLQGAKRLHAALIVSGFHHTNSNSQLCPLLVQSYADSGCLRGALLLRRLDINIACNAILRAHLDAALFSQATHFFTHLICTLAFVPDNYTCPLIFNACSSLSSLEDALQVFDELPLRERDLACWTAMICGTIREGDAGQVLSLFSDMRRVGGLRPDPPLVAAVLPACGRLQGPDWDGSADFCSQEWLP